MAFRIQLLLFSGFLISNVAGTDQQILGNVPSTDCNPGHGTLCDNDGDFHVTYESAEHQLLGDHLNLKFASQDPVPGTDFQYPIGSLNVSFGHLVAVPDIHGNTGWFSCRAQISDPGLSYDDQMGIFKIIADKVKADESRLRCFINIIDDQMNDTQQIGEDPAQKFADKIDFWDRKFFGCSIDYAMLALCNWDHFGKDALTAYSVAHFYAISRATEARDDEGLKEAYFYEAFAHHYLVDLFSAGHLRAPRRVLHSDSSWIPGLDGAPGDVCNRLMHDEDSANGLWVRNKLGEGWPIYGDKQLFASKSLPNIDKAIKAMQASADEVYEFFNISSYHPASEDYIALKMVPDVDLDGVHNFVPMFAIDTASENTSLLHRADLGSRGNTTTIAYTLDELSGLWSSLRGSIETSPIIEDMYARTQESFIPEANITQIRQLNETHLLINRYGPVWTRLYGNKSHGTMQRSWNMFGQDAIHLGLDDHTTWESVYESGDSIFSLVGSNSQGTVLAGIRDVSREFKDSEVEIIWNTVLGPDSDCKNATYVNGNFSASTTETSFVRYCNGSNPWFELWVQSTSTEAPILADSWAAPGADFRSLLALRIADSSFFVDAAYFSSNSSYVWTLANWSKSLSNRTETIFVEEDVYQPAQQLLVDTDSENITQDIVRISYGSNINETRIEVLAFDQGTLNISRGQTFSGLEISFYTSVSWFVNSLEPNSTPALIAYCTGRDDDSILVATFSSNGTWFDSDLGPTYQDPQLSNFTSDTLLKFSGPFSKHLTVVSTPVSDPQLPKHRRETEAGLLEIFDNYGILGARMLTPRRGNETIYEVAWQLPAIAGQLSDAIGEKPEIGFIFH